MSRSKKKKKSSGKLLKKIILIAVLVGVATFTLGMLLNKDDKESVEFNPNNGDSTIYCYKCGEESLTGENICFDCKEENSNEDLENPNNTQNPGHTLKPDNTVKPEEDKEDTSETVKPEETTKPENPQPEKPKYKCAVCKQLVDKVSETSDGPACAKCIENVNSGMYTCLNGYSDVCRGCSKCIPIEDEEKEEE